MKPFHLTFTKTLILTALFLLASCSQKQSSTTNKVEKMSELKITSPAFENNGKIPSKYTCQGKDISPPLNIEEIPENTKSLLLIVDDPDAPMGTWDHWLIWNIPLISKIEEGKAPNGAVQGLNDFNKHEYGGPCPPSGTHRYFFKLFALDTKLGIEEKSKKGDIKRAMQDHVLAEATLIGLYSEE